MAVVVVVVVVADMAGTPGRAAVAARPDWLGYLAEAHWAEAVLVNAAGVHCRADLSTSLEATRSFVCVVC